MRTIITHPEMGIFLGCALGLGFWSKLDAVGQSMACTFKDTRDAAEFIATWDGGNDPANYIFVEGEFSQYATVPQLMAAGLTPMLGEMEAHYLRDLAFEGHREAVGQQFLN